jgi:hypothetical protein
MTDEEQVAVTKRRRFQNAAEVILEYKKYPDIENILTTTPHRR